MVLYTLNACKTVYHIALNHIVHWFQYGFEHSVSPGECKLFYKNITVPSIMEKEEREKQHNLIEVSICQSSTVAMEIVVEC